MEWSLPLQLDGQTYAVELTHFFGRFNSMTIQAYPLLMEENEVLTPPTRKHNYERR